MINCNVIGGKVSKDFRSGEWILENIKVEQGFKNAFG